MLRLELRKGKLRRSTTRKAPVTNKGEPSIMDSKGRHPPAHKVGEAAPSGSKSEATAFL